MEHHRPQSSHALTESGPAIDAAQRPARTRWAVIVSAWSVPALIAGMQIVFAYQLRRVQVQPTAFIDPVRWLSWALVTPLIFKLTERFPLRGPQRWRSAAIHLACGFVISVVVESFWTGMALYLRQFIEPNMPGRFMTSNVFLALVIGRTASSMVTYGAVVSVAAAIEYARRVHESELHAAKLESQLASSQVQALKMQLHPHFLFNTLHAVNVLIARDPAAATRMVTRLGDLLRITLSRAASAEVPWSDELDLVALYFEIERTRFHDRLSVEYDVDPATPRALVPDLILQPLAENAIRHGVAESAGMAKIVVRSRVHEKTLILEVQDNGRGLLDAAARKDGVGLRSTRERLAKLYGAEQSFELVEPGGGGGCIARLRLPLRFAAAEV